uniref:Vacuolar protein sorting-associated protein 18 homolog n=1 Tax=Panagrellus redivivus TaxID=6233 RepID=A0A7E4UXY6_PANRE
MAQKQAPTIDYKPIGNGRFCERNRLLEGHAALAIDSADFPGLPNDAFTEKFRCCCKLALSVKNQLLAVVTPDRQLELYGLKEDAVQPKCRLRVLYDPHPEYCLLEWSASQNLLISTRSTAVLDVFESTGVYAYSFALGDQIFDPRKIVTQIRTTPAVNEPDIYDYAYILQLHSKFSVYKLGKGNYFEPVCTQSLGLPQTYAFAHFPTTGFIVVSTEFKLEKELSKDLSFTELGLALYEYRYGHIITKEVPERPKGWSSWLPIISDNRAVIVSLEANLNDDSVLAISSRGDAILFDSDLKILKLIDGDLVIPEARFLQAAWTEEKDLVVLHRNGLIIHESFETFFDAYLSGDLQGSIVDNCGAVFTSTTSDVYALAEHEVSGPSAVSANAYLNQFWFFTILRLNFFYKWIKAISGAVVGQPLENVHSDFERIFQYSVFRVRTVTLLQYVQKLLSKGNYSEALNLAKSDPNFDIDLIYKKQWADLKGQVDSNLVEVLRNVSDSKWVVSESLECLATDPSVQRQILEVAELAASDTDDADLISRVDTAKVIFESLEKSLFDAQPELFLRYRGMSLVEAGLHFARECHLDVFVPFVKQHATGLIDHVLVLLELVPEAVSFHKVEALFPWVEAGEGRLFVLEDLELPTSSENLPNDFKSLEKLKLSNAPGPLKEFISNWAENRAIEIDANTGLLDNAVDFLQIVVNHGFDSLKPVLKRFSLYRDFVGFTNAVALTFNRFKLLGATELANSIIKHMPERQIRAQIRRIVELFEEFYPETAAPNILEVVKAYSQEDFGLLHALWSVRREYVSPSLLKACFSESTLTGAPLVSALEKFSFEPDVAAAAQVALEYGFEPRFSMLADARTSDELATHVVLRLLKAALAESDPNSILILDALKQLRGLLFEEVLSEASLLTLFASQLLDKLAPERFMGFPFHLVVDVSFKNPKKLSAEAWEQLLITKSNDFIDLAMPSKSDSNLNLAREVLTLLPGKAADSPAITQQKHLLDVIESCLGLGATRIPATYRFVEPETLLAEVVAVKGNYKQVKRCAELSQLLGIKPAVAKAMAFATKEAMHADDVSIVGKYVKKLNSSARDLPVIYGVCKEIVLSGRWPELKEDLIACMVLNCPEDEITVLSDILKDCKISSVNEPKRSRSKLPEDDGELHLDSAYTSTNYFYKLADDDDSYPAGFNVENPAAWAALSATTGAVLYAMKDTVNENEATHWCKNDILYKASIGLKRILASGVEVDPDVLAQLPTEFLLQLADPNTVVDAVGDAATVVPPVTTAVERVLRAGCDRERFFEDAEYRKDSLLGLIMTKDKRMIEDIREVAEQFKVPSWELYMSLVEYILTEGDVSPAEARDLIKEHQLRETLWEDQPHLYSTLRSSVLPLIPEKDLNRLKLYLTFFRAPEPEVVFFKVLPHVLQVKGGPNLHTLLTGDEKQILAWWMIALDTPGFQDSDLVAVLRFFKALPNAEAISAKLSSFLGIAPDLGAARRAKLLFYVLDRRAEVLIEQVASDMSASAEEAFWNEVLSDWDTETADKYEVRLLDKVRRRLREMKNAPSQSSAFTVKPSEPVIMKRRKP